MVLKIDDTGNQVNIRDKENQRKMIFLKSHPSLNTNDLNDMVNFATNNNIDILTNIPLMFLLRKSKYQDLLWQYTRSLFYISQILISKVDETNNLNNTNNINIITEKKKIFEYSMSQLEIILLKYLILKRILK